MRRFVAELNGAGLTAAYVSHSIEAARFLDDAHLTPDGNHEVAASFVNLVLRWLDEPDMTASATAVLSDPAR